MEDLTVSATLSQAAEALEIHTIPVEYFLIGEFWGLILFNVPLCVKCALLLPGRDLGWLIEAAI